MQLRPFVFLADDRKISEGTLIVRTKRTDYVLEPPLPQFQHTAIPWSPHIRYLGLVLDSKLVFTKHLHTVTCKATGAFLQLFPLLARDSTLTLHNKLTIYKLLIRPILTNAAPVWSNTSPSIIDISNYYNPNVLESSVTTLDVLLSHTFIPPSHSNPFTSLFIA